jgi:hypothetical protein
MDIKTHIDGHPCIVRVLDWEPYVPAKISGPPESCYPEEGGFGDYEILDPKGQPAPWLEALLTEEDNDRITDLINDAIDAQRHEPDDDRPAYTY